MAVDPLIPRAASAAPPEFDALNAVEPADLPGSPDPILAEWLPANDDPARPLMTVASVAADGGPDARTLLLSEYGPEGFWFHTDGRSRKAAQIVAEPLVALVLVWPELRRQLVVLGAAEPADEAEEARAYRARNPYLQQLAWLNTVAFAQRPIDERLAEWAAFAADRPDGYEEPSTWAGYLVRPTRLTFWSGSTTTASRRVEYARATPESAWTVSVLAG